MSKNDKIVCFGAAGLDMLAYVNQFPVPDEKLRTQFSLITGGGNAANTATTLARLQHNIGVASCVGDDSAGLQIISELQANGIDISSIVVRSASSSPFTYVIIAEDSRTCLHTPGTCGELSRVDTTDEFLSSIFNSAWLLHCDSRHTEAAVQTAREAEIRGVLVSVDVERERPFLYELLPLADFIFTNSSFPFECTSMDCHSDMSEVHAAMLRRFQKARFVCSTSGSKGAFLTHRRQFASAHSSPKSLIDESGQLLRPAVDSFDSIRIPACPLDGPVIDTTGAGDSFIGGCLHGIQCGLPLKNVLECGAFVAARKVQGRGSRGNLPGLDELNQAIGIRSPSESESDK